MISTTDTETARAALVEALHQVLVALVALQGLDDLEPPTDALDLALGLHDPYRAARARFRELHRGLRGVVADDVFFEFESVANEMVVIAADVGFMVGVSTTRTRS